MTLPKLLFITAIILFTVIGVAAFIKNDEQKTKQVVVHNTTNPTEIEIDSDGSYIEVVKHEQVASKAEHTEQRYEKNNETVEKPTSSKYAGLNPPEADRIEELFNLTDPKLPIVETISYKSKTSWMKGRPAWLSDYAAHFKTSRHFIARSLNGKADYLKQDIAEGSKFNILNPEKNIHFNLIVDASRCKLWFYYHDLDSKEKVLIKTYRVGLGRKDSGKISGSLTPFGVYTLGSRIAVYKPKDTGIHNGSKIEMIQTFGTRWIPFENEISKVTAPAKGFGLHGAPWVMKNGSLKEDVDSIGKYESDGCVRMSKEDIEELYAIIISRPTTIEIVQDFFDAENKIYSDKELAENK